MAMGETSLIGEREDMEERWLYYQEECYGSTEIHMHYRVEVYE
jgi:hypothetical protein